MQVYCFPQQKFSWHPAAICTVQKWRHSAISWLYSRGIILCQLSLAFRNPVVISHVKKISQSVPHQSLQIQSLRIDTRMNALFGLAIFFRNTRKLLAAIVIRQIFFIAEAWPILLCKIIFDRSFWSVVFNITLAMPEFYRRWWGIHGTPDFHSFLSNHKERV